MRQVNTLVKILLLSLLLNAVACQKVLVEENFKGEDRDRAVDIHIQAAMAYLNRKNVEDARRHVDKALQIKPKSAQAYNAMALIYKYELDEENEERYYKKAISADSGYSAARNNYAVLLFREKKYKSALRQLEKVVEDTSYPKRASAFENIGRCHLKLDSPEEAELAFKRALRLDPRAAGALLELGWLAYTSGEFKQAGEYYQELRKIARQNSRALWLGIKIAERTGDDDTIASNALALRNLYPDSKEYQMYLDSGHAQ